MVTPGPGVENFLCEIVPVNITNPTGGHVTVQVTTELADMEDGTYELTYNLPYEGQYELSVRLFNRDISGSPFKVN